MGKLFFQAEYETTFEAVDGGIRIEQLDAFGDCSIVVLSRHQFDELINHSDYLLKCDVSGLSDCEPHEGDDHGR